MKHFKELETITIIRYKRSSLIRFLTFNGNNIKQIVL